MSLTRVRTSKKCPQKMRAIQDRCVNIEQKILALVILSVAGMTEWPVVATSTVLSRAKASSKIPVAAAALTFVTGRRIAANIRVLPTAMLIKKSVLAAKTAAGFAFGLVNTVPPMKYESAPPSIKIASLVS